MMKENDETGTSSTSSTNSTLTTIDFNLIVLENTSESQNDDGAYDTTYTSTLTYDGQEIWSKRSNESSNSGGAWGSKHEAVLSEDRKTITVTTKEVGGDVYTGYTAQENEPPTTLVVEKLIAEKVNK